MSGIAVGAVVAGVEVPRVPTQLFINGEWRDAADGATFDVVAPATEEQLAQVAAASAADVDAAVRAARAQIDGAEDKVIAWSAGGNDRKIKGNDYLQQFAVPNFFFFVTTAYDILRWKGVKLGKRDFLGRPRLKL